MVGGGGETAHWSSRHCLPRWRAGLCAAGCGHRLCSLSYAMAARSAASAGAKRRAAPGAARPSPPTTSGRCTGPGRRAARRVGLRAPTTPTTTHSRGRPRPGRAEAARSLGRGLLRRLRLAQLTTEPGSRRRRQLALAPPAACLRAGGPQPGGQALLPPRPRPRCASGAGQSLRVRWTRIWIWI